MDSLPSEPPGHEFPGKSPASFPLPSSSLLTSALSEEWYCHFCTWKKLLLKSVVANIEGTLESSGECLKFPILSTFYTPIKSESLGVRPGITAFWKLSWGFQNTVKVENHSFKSAATGCKAWYAVAPAFPGAHSRAVLGASSVQFSHSVMSNSLQPHGLQHGGLPVHHQLPEFTQTHFHQVGDTLQPSYPLSSHFPPAFNLSQCQGLFQWIANSPMGGKAHSACFYKEVTIYPTHICVYMHRHAHTYIYLNAPLK